MPSNPSSQNEAETVDNHVQVLKSVPVNMSLITEQKEAKRELIGSSTAGESSADGGSPAAAVVKAEVYAPVFMVGGGLPYRVEGEERLVYEQSSYELTAVSHGSYVKEDKPSPPDSPYEDDTDRVRKDTT